MRKLALLSLLLPRFALAALALDGTAQTGGTWGSTVPVTLTTTGTNRLIVCMLTVGGADDVTGVTVTGSTLGAFAAGPAMAPATSLKYSGIFYKWAAAAVTSETITAAWTGPNGVNLSCLAIAGARDPTSLVSGTDYGVGTLNSASTNAPSISITTKGTSGSWLVGVGIHWSATTVTADANSVIVFETLDTVHLWSERSTVTYTAGAHAIGVTTDTTESAVMAAMEILDASATGPVTAGKANYYRNAVQNQLLRGSAFSFPASLVAHLYSTCPTVSTAGMELSGSGYSAPTITSNATNWNSASSGQTTNATVISFGTATASWTGANCIGLTDASSNLFVFGPLTGAPVTVINGETAKIPAAGLQVSDGQ